MSMAFYFNLAPRELWVIEANDIRTVADTLTPSSGSFGDPAEWRTISTTTLHTDADDPCDPTMTTKVIQMTDHGYAWAIVRAAEDAKGEDPDDAAKISVESVIADAIHEVFQPSRCWCEHDCCGHRYGRASVRHIGGAMFLVQINTARNY